MSTPRTPTAQDLTQRIINEIQVLGMGIRNNYPFTPDYVQLDETALNARMAAAEKFVSDLCDQGADPNGKGRGDKSVAQHALERVMEESDRQNYRTSLRALKALVERPDFNPHQILSPDPYSKDINDKTFIAGLADLVESAGPRRFDPVKAMEASNLLIAAMTHPNYRPDAPVAYECASLEDYRAQKREYSRDSHKYDDSGNLEKTLKEAALVRQGSSLEDARKGPTPEEGAKLIRNLIATSPSVDRAMQKASINEVPMSASAFRTVHFGNNDEYRVFRLGGNGNDRESIDKALEAIQKGLEFVTHDDPNGYCDIRDLGENGNLGKMVGEFGKKTGIYDIACSTKAIADTLATYSNTLPSAANRVTIDAPKKRER